MITSPGFKDVDDNDGKKGSNSDDDGREANRCFYISGLNRNLFIWEIKIEYIVSEYLTSLWLM